MTDNASQITQTGLRSDEGASGESLSMSRMERENHLLKQQIATLQYKLEILAVDYHILSTGLEPFSVRAPASTPLLNAPGNEARARLAGVKAAFELKQQQVSTLRVSTLREQVEEVRRLRGELDALHRSTSWRVTKPLRAVRLLMSRRK